MYSKAYNDGKKTYITKAKILEFKAKLELHSEESERFSVTLAQISKAMGFKVDQNTTTVREFYSYIEYLKNG